ncbi:acyl-CoA dehydrogenase family protein [Rhodococcus artemisiae]|uniref:Acyl-CoA dehydrogenase family protein n=1 Tax=Rhodococcus artemisiae TaxID=714159 RepID=A0ABU7L9C7_9NOCA|nr:acyl-CoA dehydrogenase family protein [Rhodococcus artemisiae]MEE2058151.1 acyl-CoA dehydrogenase family protein [Rhodococcus artemisiae]
MNSTALIDSDVVDMMTSVFAAHCADRITPGAAVEFDENLWQVLDELGLTRLTGAESHGGSGADWHTASALLAAASGAAVTAPLVEHDLLAGWLLDTAGLPMGDGLGTAFLMDPSGTTHAVPWARHARFAVPLRLDGDRWVVAHVDADRLDIRRSENLAGEPRDTVTIEVDDVKWVPVLQGTAESFFLRGALARVLQMCGAMERVVELCIEHVSGREQFGRALSKFQAVQRLVSHAAAETALARASADAAVAHVERAGWDDRASIAVAVAKSCAGHAASTVVRNAHQVHGAIGTTSEHDLHRFTRPVLAWRSEFGSVARWDRLLTKAAVDAGRDGAWSLVAHGGAVPDLLAIVRG